MTMPSKPLHARKLRFAERYLETGNATQSAKEAGYSVKSAHVTGSSLLRDRHVLEYMTERRKSVASRIEHTIEQLAVATACAAYVDPAGFFRSDGTPKAPDELTVEQRAAIQSIEVVEITDAGVTRRVFKYEFVDRNTAQERLGKHLGFFQQENRERPINLAELFSFIEQRGSKLPAREIG